MKYSKALIATVRIGSLEVEGLLLSTAEFGMSLQQLRELAFPSVHPKNASRELKAACGKGFEFIKCPTELNNRPQSIILLDQVNYCLTELAFRGHNEARELVRILSGMSLHQLFCDAFNIQFGKEDRQRWIYLRESTRQTFHPLTAQLQSYGYTEPWQYGKFIHDFQERLGIEDGSRDKLPTDKLGELIAAQSKVAAYIDAGLKPYEALNKI